MAIVERILNLKHRAVKYLSITYLVFSLVYLLITVVRIPSHTKYLILDTMYMVPVLLAVLGSAAAAVLSWRRTKLVEYTKFWIYLFSATLFLFIGELIWVYYEIVRKMETPPFPSIGDYFFLSSYIFFFAMVVSFMRHSDLGVFLKTRSLLQIFTLIIFTYVLFWIYVLKPLSVNIAKSSIEEALVTFMYSAIDVGVLFGISTNLILSRGKEWENWEIMVGLGLITYSAGNFLFNYLFLSNSYTVNNILASVCDLFWMTGYFLYFLSPVSYLTKSYRQEEREHFTRIVMPAVRLADILFPVAVLLAIPYFTYLSHFYSPEDTDYWIFLVSVVALTLLTGVKIVLVLLENRKLTSLITIDFLTGLHNHRFFHETLEVEIERAKRTRKPLSIAIIDIDILMK